MDNIYIEGGGAWKLPGNFKLEIIDEANDWK